jgi:hypothetical protein
MSIRLLTNPRTPHELFDDLESVYWTMLYGAFHRFRHKRRINMNMFSDTHFEQDGDITGGDLKLSALLTIGSSLTFECRPLNVLFLSLSMALRAYYLAFFEASDEECDTLDPVHKDSDPVREAQAAVDFHYQRLSKPSFWREELKSALSMEDWIDNDIVNEDRYKKLTHEEALRKFELASRTLYARNQHKRVSEKRRRTNGLEATHDSGESSRKEYGDEKLPVGNDDIDSISTISDTQRNTHSSRLLTTSSSDLKLAPIPSHSELPVSKTTLRDPESQPVKSKRSFVEDDNVVAEPFNAEPGSQRKRLRVA